jgi:transposase InsO family protein
MFLSACRHHTAPPKTPAAPSASQPAAAQPAAQQAVTEHPVLPPVSAPAALSDAEKKLDTALIEIARAWRSGGAAAAGREMEARSLDTKDQKVKVEIVARDKAAMPELKQRIVQLGGEVTAELENHIWVYLPAAAIDDLSRADIVWTMSASIATVRAK